MITFRKIPPLEIDNLSKQALKYLEDAVIRTPASTSRLDVTLDIAKRGYGNVYLIFNNDVLTGACYLLVYPTKNGKVLAPCLVGGDQMQLWHDDFIHFLKQFSDEINAYKVRWIGRKGWKKKFPKSKVIGYIFEHEVGVL